MKCDFLYTYHRAFRTLGNFRQNFVKHQVGVAPFNHLYLTDLPSNGDTSYVGLVMEGDTVYATYYTSPINHDFAWLMGMFAPSEIRMAVIDLSAMEALADRTEAK